MIKKMKIYVIGHPGSGKSYLADQLSNKSGLEKIDIDVLFDKHPFYALSKKLYAKALDKLIRGRSNWIIDGYHVNLMPDAIWKGADQVIYLNIPKQELKQNIHSRYKAKKTAREFSHWQSTKVNNLKSFVQIKFQNKALQKDIARIKLLLSDRSKFIELGNRDEIQQYIDHFPDAA